MLSRSYLKHVIYRETKKFKMLKRKPRIIPTRQKMRVPPLSPNFAEKFLETEMSLSKQIVNVIDVQDYIHLCSRAIEFWDSKDTNKSLYYKEKMQNVLQKNNVIDAQKSYNPPQEKNSKQNIPKKNSITEKQQKINNDTKTLTLNKTVSDSTNKTNIFGRPIKTREKAKLFTLDIQKSEKFNLCNSHRIISNNVKKVIPASAREIIQRNYTNPNNNVAELSSQKIRSFSKNFETLNKQNSEEKVNKMISAHQDKGSTKDRILNAHLEKQMEDIKSKISERSQSRNYKSNSIVTQLNKTSSDASFFINQSFNLEKLKLNKSISLGSRTKSVSNNSTLLNNIKDRFLSRRSMKHAVSFNDRIIDEMYEDDELMDKDILKDL